MQARAASSDPWALVVLAFQPQARSPQPQTLKRLAACPNPEPRKHRYLDEPMLIEGRKFDVRCWVLLDPQVLHVRERKGSGFRV